MPTQDNEARTDTRLPGFGLVARKSGGFALSTYRDERLKAPPSVAAAPFAGRDYGSKFW
jgi:hypothetical protein